MSVHYVGAPLGPKDIARPIDAEEPANEAEAEELDSSPKVEGVVRPISTRGMIGIGVIVVIVVVALLDGLSIIHIDLGIDKLWNHSSSAAAPSVSPTPSAFADAASSSGVGGEETALASIIKSTPPPGSSSDPNSAVSSSGKGPVPVRGLHGPASAPAAAAAAPVSNIVPPENPFQSASSDVPNVDVSGPSTSYQPPTPPQPIDIGSGPPGYSSQPNDPTAAARTSEISPAVAIAAAFNRVRGGDGAIAPTLTQPLGAQNANAPDIPQTPQQRSAAGFDRTSAGGYLPSSREPALSKYEIWPGRYLRMLLDGDIIVDLPGQICAHLLEPARDSATGKIVLMPERTEICGKYNTIISAGASRIQIAFNVATFPDGSTLTMGGMGAADRNGWSGLSADVNNHIGAVIGSALLTSVVSGVLAATNPPATSQIGSQIGQAQNQTPGQAAGQSISQSGQQIVNQKVNLPPTLSLKRSTEIMLAVDRAIVLQPYQPIPPLDERPQ